MLKRSQMLNLSKVKKKEFENGRRRRPYKYLARRKRRIGRIKKNGRVVRKSRQGIEQSYDRGSVWGSKNRIDSRRIKRMGKRTLEEEEEEEKGNCGIR